MSHGRQASERILAMFFVMSYSERECSFKRDSQRIDRYIWLRACLRSLTPNPQCWYEHNIVSHLARLPLGRESTPK